MDEKEDLKLFINASLFLPTMVKGKLYITMPWGEPWQVEFFPKTHEHHYLFTTPFKRKIFGREFTTNIFERDLYQRRPQKYRESKLRGIKLTGGGGYRLLFYKGTPEEVEKERQNLYPPEVVKKYYNEGSLVTTSRGFSQREDSYYNEYAFPWVRYGYFFEKPKVFRFLGQEEKIEKEEAEKRIKTYELEAKKYIEGRIPNINIKCPVKNDKYDIYYPNLVIRKLEKKEVTSKWI